MPTYGQQVMIARRDRGLSQDECANKLDISRNWLSQIELDQARNISLDLAAKIAKTLQVRHPLMDTGLVVRNEAFLGADTIAGMILDAWYEYGIHDGVQLTAQARYNLRRFITQGITETFQRHASTDDIDIPIKRGNRTN